MDLQAVFAKIGDFIKFKSTVSSPHLPKKGPIDKSPVNQFMNPSRAPIYCGFGLLSLGKTEKSTIEGGSLQTGPRARCESASFSDDDLDRANGRFGGQTAGGHPKAFPRPGQPLLPVPAVRELESACRVSVLRCCHSAHGLLFMGWMMS